MAVGLSAANLANKWLDMLSGTAFTPPAGSFIKLHTGDPGSAGTANASANTTRVAASWGSAAAGVKSIVATFPSWASWASGTETLSHISEYDASTAGSFLFSAALTTSKTITNGDTFTLSSLSFSLTPIAS